MKLSWKTLLKNAAIMLAAALFVLGACAPAARNAAYAPPQALPVEKAMDQTGVMEAPAAAPVPMQESGGTQQSANQTQERLVIQNANMTIVVPDPTGSMERISKMAEEMGGYIVAANMYKETLASGIEVPRGTITIRVPAEKLRSALDQIRAESGEEPLNESLNSQDVTNEYVDLESRLKNLEAAEQELTKIMEDAHRTEDVLSVYNQLVQIREQIEVIKGQMKYYEQSAALSAVTVELVADKSVQPIEIGGWKPTGIAKEAVEALLKTMQFFISAAIWVVIYLVPVLLVLFLIFVLPPVLIIRAWRKRRAAKKANEKGLEPPSG